MNPVAESPRTQEISLLLDGRSLANGIRQELRERIADFENRCQLTPSLAVLLVGDEPDSVVYAESLVKWFTRMGLGCSVVQLPAAAGQDTVVREAYRASRDTGVNGLLVQLPLPEHLSCLEVFRALDPLKDVEGMHPENMGLLAAGQERFVPTTPLAGMEILRAYDISLEGAHAVVVGRSNVVGKPLAHLLLEQHATVTVLHSRSRDLVEHTRRADILAVAVGRANLITRSMVKPGAVVLDFGINFVGDQMVGDVAFDEVCEVAARITPVPGGVGPLTNVMLARNLLLAAELQVGRSAEMVAS